MIDNNSVAGQVSILKILFPLLLYSIIIFSCISGQYYIKINNHDLAIGMLIFPLTYIINAANTEIFNFRYARQTIIIVAINTFLLGMLIHLFSTVSFSGAYIGNVKAYSHFCARLSALLFFTGFGFFVSEYVNSYIIMRLKLLWSGRRLVRRAVIAIFIAIIVDTTLFIPFILARHESINGVLFEWLIDIFLRGGIIIFFMPIFKILIYYHHVSTRQIHKLKPPEYASLFTSVEYLKNAQ